MKKSIGVLITASLFSVFFSENHTYAWEVSKYVTQYEKNYFISKMYYQYTGGTANAEILRKYLPMLQNPEEDWRRVKEKIKNEDEAKLHYIAEIFETYFTNGKPGPNEIEYWLNFNLDDNLSFKDDNRGQDARERIKALILRDPNPGNPTASGALQSRRYRLDDLEQRKALENTFLVKRYFREFTNTDPTPIELSIHIRDLNNPAIRDHVRINIKNSLAGKKYFIINLFKEYTGRNIQPSNTEIEEWVRALDLVTDANGGNIAQAREAIRVRFKYEHPSSKRRFKQSLHEEYLSELEIPALETFIVRDGEMNTAESWLEERRNFLESDETRVYNADAILLRSFESELVRSYSETAGEEEFRSVVDAHPRIFDLLIDVKRFGEAKKRSKLEPALIDCFLSNEARLNLTGGIQSLRDRNVGISTKKNTIRKIYTDVENSLVMSPFVNELFSKIIGSLVNQDNGIDLDRIENEGMRYFLTEFFNDYFRKIHINLKKHIVAGHLKLHPYATSDELLISFLNNSGPIMHKVIQLLANETNNDALKKLLDNFKKNITPMSSQELDRAKHVTFKGSFNRLFRRFEDTSLATASIGEVHRAESATGNRLVVKLKKPNLDEKSQQELALMRPIAEDADIDIVEKLESSLNKELDFSLEKDNMDLGRKYTDFQKNIYCVKLAGDLRQYQNCIGMNEVIGKGMHEVEVENGDYTKVYEKEKLLSDLLGIWFKRALFEDGFFHADLHGGNMLFSEAQNPRSCTLIDFGSCGTLTPDMRNGLVMLIIATQQGWEWKILGSLEKIASTSEINKNDGRVRRDLERMVQDILAEDIDVGSKVSRIIDAAIQLKINLPEEIVLFNRGWKLLSQELQSAKQVLRDGGQAPRTPEESTIYEDIIRRGTRTLSWTTSLLWNYSWGLLGNPRAANANPIPNPALNAAQAGGAAAAPAAPAGVPINDIQKFQIVSMHNTGKCLTIELVNDQVVNGSLLTLRDCGDRENQLWEIELLNGSTDYFHIWDTNRSKVLDLHSPDRNKNGAKIHMWEDLGTQQTNQHWKLEKTPGGSFRIISRASNKSLDAAFQHIHSDGTPIQQWDCRRDNGHKNQLWYLRPVFAD